MTTVVDRTFQPREVPVRAARQWRRVLTHTHTYSGRADHGGAVAPPEAYHRLVDWALAQGVDAIGMGSPYTPATANMQRRYDGADRQAYYSGEVNPSELRQLDEVQRMLASLRNMAGDACLFYLDNETPKGRYGHMWWIGYHPDLPPWHDYDQPFDRWMVHQSRPDDDSDEPVPYERRPYAQIVAIQRRHGALGVWAHPTSWWRDDDGRFITNLATEMPAHAAADGGVDGMVVMGYQAYRPAYQALWYAMLDRGYRVPAAAEMDCGLSSQGTWHSDRMLLNHLPVDGDGELTLAQITERFRSGRLSVSSGPTLDLRVDGQAMGDIVPTSRGHVHQVEITAQARAGHRLSRVELIGRGGRVVWHTTDAVGGVMRVQVDGSDERGYLVARAFGPAKPGVADTDQRRFDQFAVTNPVYLHPPGQGFAQKVRTRATVSVAAGSPFHGGTVRFEAADGTRLESGSLVGGTAAAVLPGTGRVTVTSAAADATRTIYLINANPQLQSLQRYLYRGRFLRDFPDLSPGEVPVEAWQLDEFPRAMADLLIEV
ncbi:MAG: CehA/McbA family metallohydrolase [Phycisphaeraceae bacterium]